MRLADRPKRLSPLKIALAGVVGTIGGAIFYWLDTPLPWMLGSMVFCMAAALLRAPASMPAAMRRPSVTIIGVMLGGSFHPDILQHIATWSISLLGLVAVLTTATAASVLYYRSVAGFDPITAYFAGVPGGIAEMIALGEQRGADIAAIALAHASRIFLVVMTFPFLLQLIGVEPGSPSGATAPRPMDWVSLGTDYVWVLVCATVGGAIGWRLKLPGYALIGPMLVSAAVHISGLSNFKSPPELLAVAQVVMGASIGFAFAGRAVRDVARILVLATGSMALFTSIALAGTFSVSHLTGIQPSLLLLSYAAAGFAEMSIMALVLKLEVAFVATHHIVRMFLIIALAPAFVRFFTPPGPKERRPVS